MAYDKTALSLQAAECYDQGSFSFNGHRIDSGDEGLLSQVI